VRHAENPHVFTNEVVDNDVIVDWKAAGTWAKFIVSCPAHLGMSGQQIETIGNGDNFPVGDCFATTFSDNIFPYPVKIVAGLSGKVMHCQACVCRSAARRSRPRRITSSVRSRMDSRVIGMPSPRSIEALASSRLSRTSDR
jgi:hypothetical protein